MTKKKNKQSNEVKDLIDEKIIEENKQDEIDLKAAEAETFEPNQPKKGKIIGKILLILLLVFILFNVIYFYFFVSLDNELGFPTKTRTETKLNIKKLGLLVAEGGDETIEAELLDQKLDKDKIVWTSENNQIIKLEDCKGLTCKIKANELGDTIVTAFYNHKNYDTIQIKVINNNHIYVYQSSSYYADEQYLSTYFSTKEDQTQNKIYDYKCNTLDCKAISVTNNNILIKDDNYYIINYESGNKETLDFDLSSYNYISLLDTKDQILGLILDNKKVYSFAKNKITINDNSINVINSTENSLALNDVVANDENYSYIYDIDTGKKVITLSDSDITDIQKITLNKISYYLICEGWDYPVYKLYDLKYNLKIDNIADYYLSKDNTIYIIKTGATIFTQYDDQLNVIYTSKNYKSVYQFTKDYIIVLDQDDNLNLINLDENKVTTFVKMTSKMYFHSMISGYYEEKGKKGIYVIVEDDTLDTGKHDMPQGYEYYYIPTTGETGKIATEIGGYAKPVLYLYPTKNKTEVTVTFAHPEYLTTTYPKYNKNWVVTANKDGSLYDSKNQYYYALYWEESKYKKTDFKTGFYVTKDNASKFLEEKLDQIGLTRKEANEFIMYWLPILEKNQKNLVYFELTDSRQKFNKLNINPQPDSLLRVAIHVKKVNCKKKIKEEKLTKFTRTGFTAVEWGGVNYK
jgi:uncharacterized protein YdhG (YjbR/CyaY superfamily)